MFALGTTLGSGVGGEGGGAVAGISALIALVLGLVVFALVLAAAYVLPIGVCGMVHDDALGGAFDVDRIREVATDRDYAVAWGAGAVTLLVGGGVAQFLALLLVGFPLLFAAQVLAFRLFARGYADALGLDIAPEGGTPTATGAGATSPTSVPDPDPTGTNTLGVDRPDETDASDPERGEASTDPGDDGPEETTESDDTDGASGASDGD